MIFILTLIVIIAAVLWYRETQKEKVQKPAPKPQMPKLQQKQQPDTQQFPHPAKQPGGCRFPSDSDIANFQEYGEEPVTMHESEFKEWWFFCEDPDKPVWSYVGTDQNQQRCILQRRYRHGSDDHPTFAKRFFVIKRNIMASVFALALIEGKMDRNDYKEQMAKLDRLFPPTGNTETDGPPVLLPPQELLDNPSEEEMAEMKREEERRYRHGKVVYEDGVRKLFYDGDVLKLRYNGKDYTFSGHGYEPMAIILGHDGETAYIHNSFLVEDECREFVKNPDYRCSTITGRRHDAKSFCLLLTTAIDDGYDWQIDELESRVDELTRFETREVWYKENGIEFGRYGEEEGGREEHHYEHEILYIIVDGHKYHLNDNVEEANALYFFIPGAFSRRNGRSGLRLRGYKKSAVLRIHGTNGAVLAAYADDWKSGKTFTPFGHPCDTKTFCEMIAYALRSGKKDFNLQELEKAFELEDYQARRKKMDEESSQKEEGETLHMVYTRESVCAADDYINKSLNIDWADFATLEDLVSYINNYHEDGGFDAIPYTGGDAKWRILSGETPLAEVGDDGRIISFCGNDPRTPLSRLKPTKLHGERLY